MKKIGFIFFSLILCSCVPMQYEEGEQSELSFEDKTRRPASEKKNTEEEVISEVSNLEVRLGDRYYIANVFKDVFGPSFNNSSHVYTNVISKQGVFGGGCDLYERSLRGVNTTSVENAWHQCFDTNWNTDQSLKSTTLREGWRVRACELIISSNGTAVNHAFSKAQVDRNDDAYAEGLNKLYQLFYPLEDLPKSTQTEMLNWAEQINDTQEFWESSLLAFCITPGWQIP